MEINLEAFKKNYLVSGLSDEAVGQVVELAELKVAKRTEEFVSLGSKDADLYVILDGIAVVYRKGGVILGERGPGSVIGEIALVDDLPRSAYVLAKESLVYARLDGKKLRKFMFENKDIGFIMLSNLTRVLSMRLREASAAIEDLQGKLTDSDPWKFAT